MDIIFQSRTKTDKAGKDTVSFSDQTFKSGDVVLQGFYMSYGTDTSYEVEDLEAHISAVSFNQSGSDFTCKYDFSCDMDGNEGRKDRDASDVELTTLVIASID